MKKKDPADIELICNKCQTSNHLSMEDSLEDWELYCEGCGAKIYWYNCPDCGTGFSSMKRISACPDCSKSDPILKSSGKSRSFFHKCCPWCNEPVNMLPFIFSKQMIKTCTSCKKPIIRKGEWSGMILFVLFLVLSAAISKSILKAFPFFALKLPAIAIILFLGLLILIKMSDLEKYKR